MQEKSLIANLKQQNIPLLPTDYGVIRITGTDATTFLQGQLTVDVGKLDSNRLTLAAHCNNKGRIVSLFYLHQAQANIFFLIMPNEILASAQDKLNKYVLFSKVEIHNVSSQYQVSGIVGSAAVSLATSGWEHESSTCLARIGETTCFLLLQPHDKRLVTTGEATTWQAALIANGIPTLLSQTQESFTPHDINLPALKAVDFNKGCYIGQEIIARMQFRGTPKKHLYRAQCVAAPTLTPGDQLITAQQQHYGNVVNVITQGTQQSLLLVIQEALLNEAIFTTDRRPLSLSEIQRT